MATLLSSKNITIMLFLFIGICYMVYFIYTNVFSKSDKTEHFMTDDYQARMEVMKVFDLVLNRSPTPEELKKYQEHKNEQDILVHVLKDFKSKLTVQEEQSLLDTAKVMQEQEEYPMPQPEPAPMMQQTKEPYANNKTNDEQNDEKVCMNKYYIKQLLDDLQNKIDSVRVLLG